MQQSPSLHSGHRERMRQRLDSTSLETLADHELLEALLYYVFPRRDTNALAHALIEECGSLSEVLEAERGALTQVDGIGESAARYLSLIGEAARRYTAAYIKPENTARVLDTPEKLISFMLPKFIGVPTERAYALLFDNSLSLVDLFHVGDGTVSRVEFAPRRILERALQKKAAAVVLVHNHPGGVAIPSGADLDLTRQILDLLHVVEIELLDHFIIAGSRYTSIMSSYLPRNQVEPAASPLFHSFRSQTPNT